MGRNGLKERSKTFLVLQSPSGAEASTENEKAVSQIFHEIKPSV